MARVHLFISGRVQGVFFRSFIKKHATELDVCGWVRNMEDGKVEIMAEGERKKLIELIKLVRKGPALARIKKVEVSWQKATGKLQTFGIENGV